MSAKKVVAVTGATGAQGGAVVSALLELGSYTVRAITRNAESDKVKLPISSRSTVRRDGEGDGRVAPTHFHRCETGPLAVQSG